jgi:hypothetical protein
MKGRGEHTLVPCVLDTRVFPMLRVLKISGALMSYHCFFVNGSTLQNHKKPKQETTSAHKNRGAGSEIEMLQRTSGGNRGRHSRLLLATLPPLGDALVLADRHGCRCWWSGGAAAFGGLSVGASWAREETLPRRGALYIVRFEGFHSIVRSRGASGWMDGSDEGNPIRALRNAGGPFGPVVHNTGFIHFC